MVTEAVEGCKMESCLVLQNLLSGEQSSFTPGHFGFIVAEGWN